MSRPRPPRSRILWAIAAAAAVAGIVVFALWLPRQATEPAPGAAERPLPAASAPTEPAANAAARRVVAPPILARARGMLVDGAALAPLDVTDTRFALRGADGVLHDAVDVHQAAGKQFEVGWSEVPAEATLVVSRRGCETVTRPLAFPSAPDRVLALGTIVLYRLVDQVVRVVDEEGRPQPGVHFSLDNTAINYVGKFTTDANGAVHCGVLHVVQYRLTVPTFLVVDPANGLLEPDPSRSTLDIRIRNRDRQRCIRGVVATAALERGLPKVGAWFRNERGAAYLGGLADVGADGTFCLLETNASPDEVVVMLERNTVGDRTWSPEPFVEDSTQQRAHWGDVLQFTPRIRAAGRLRIAVADEGGNVRTAFGVRIYQNRWCALYPTARDASLRSVGEHPGGAVVTEPMPEGDYWVLVEATDAAWVQVGAVRATVRAGETRDVAITLRPVQTATWTVPPRDGVPASEVVVAVPEGDVSIRVSLCLLGSEKFFAELPAPAGARGTLRIVRSVTTGGGTSVSLETFAGCQVYGNYGGVWYRLVAGGAGVLHFVDGEMPIVAIR